MDDGAYEQLPAFWRLPVSRSSSCGTLSWTEGPSCHRRGAPSSSRRACGLGSSTWSRAVRASSAVAMNHNMTTTGRAGSRADSPGSHTLSPPSSSCSLDYYIDAARCALATPAATPPCLEVPDRPAASSPRTLLTTVHLLARAQVPGLCDRAPPPAAPSPRRTAVHPHRGGPPSPTPPPPSARRVARRRRPPSPAPPSPSATPGVRRRRFLLLLYLCVCVWWGASLVACV